VYTITDQCGRTASCTQVFTIDNAAPTITCAADATVECYEDIQALVDAAVLAFNGGTDVTIACDLTWNVVGVVDPKIDNCTPSYDVVYTITDQCGRTAICTQVFTIDNAAPTITCPADATVECYEDIQAIVDAAVLAFNGGTDVTIACDLTWNVVGVVDPKIDNCTSSYDVVYTGTDQCGRTASCTQVFTIDNAAPTITCPVDATVECYEDIQGLVDAAVLAFNGGADVTIACDLTWNVVGVVDPKIDNCTPSYDVVYTITDQCGRTASCTQVFTIDNAAPTIICPADATVECYEDIQVLVDASVAAFNGGTDVTIACDLTWNVVGVLDPKVDKCTPTYDVF
jgi:3'-phosphoadenosine 5'-phosphosulfate sulfotransferase (PAPS reductase)/FAD synthetase